MADQREIAEHYDVLGPIHAIRLLREQGGFPDYTNALWNGDYSKTLDEAQHYKHTWIFENLGLTQNLAGRRILDIGCGWGPILNAVRERGGEAVGLTLSEHQHKHCTDAGLEAYLRNYKTLAPGELGQFDAVISIGAIEHFCSIKERLSGQQEQVYRDFFRICAEHLKPSGGLYLQTMTWNDDPPDYRKLSLDAPSDSPEAILARMEYLYPDSWPPSGLSQLEQCAGPFFGLTLAKDGRLDYVETLKRWSTATSNLYPWKDPGLFLKSLPHFAWIGIGWLRSKDARVQLQSVMLGDQSECFNRGIMGHQRMFFKLKTS